MYVCIIKKVCIYIYIYIFIYIYIHIRILHIPPSPKTLKSMSFAEEGLKGTFAEGSQQCRGSTAEGR